MRREFRRKGNKEIHKERKREGETEGVSGAAQRH